MRALLKGSVYFVLDDPTAALASITETELYKQLKGLALERDCVFITHRLAGVRFCNQILYFENKNIAEQENCQEHLEKQGNSIGFISCRRRCISYTIREMVVITEKTD